MLECENHHSAYTFQLRVHLPKTLGLFKLVQVGCGEPRSCYSGCTVCMKALLDAGCCSKHIEGLLFAHTYQRFTRLTLA